MKRKKLNLNELRVKSFVTEFENGKESTVRGGEEGGPATLLYGGVCEGPIPTNDEQSCYMCE